MKLIFLSAQLLEIEETTVGLLVVTLDMTVTMKDLTLTVMILPDTTVTKGIAMTAMIAMIGTTVTTAMTAMTVAHHHQDMIPTLLVPDHLIKCFESKI